MSQQNKGLKGDVLLLSPDRKSYQKIHLTGRRVKKKYVGSGKWQPDGVEVVAHGDAEKKRRERRQKRFQKLLSQGWTLSSPQELEGVFGLEWKKFTDKVDGSTKTGDASHGGDHASGEVADSPNAYDKGVKQYEKRGQRAARRRQDQKKKKNAPIPMKPQKSSQKGNGAVWSPQLIVIGQETIESAKRSAELLCQIVGQSEQKIQRGVDIDVLGLTMAFEKGENPLPYLDMPQEQSRVRVFLTNDESGSCQSFSGLTKGWAHTLAAMPNVDAFYAKNANGGFFDYAGGAKADEWFEQLLETMDFIVYLGDGDAFNRMIGLANKGAKVVYLSCVCCNNGSPRLRATHRGKKGGVLYEIDRVSNGRPEDWYTALKLVLGC